VTKSVDQPEKQMRDCADGFLRDVLALEGENSDLVREAVRVHLANYEGQGRNAEKTKRRRDRAVHTFEMQCRTRVIEAIQQNKGTLTAVHLKIVLSVIDGPVRLPLKG
jgi:hypothetical protein